MVRECRPPAREPARSWLARRSTMATSTPANANSPANISPVGPPPAITTACSVSATLRPASRCATPAHHIPRPLRSPAARSPAPACRAPATARRVLPAVRHPRATHTPTQHTRFATPMSAGSWPRWVILRHDPDLAASPPARDMVRVEGSGYLPSPYRPLWTDNDCLYADRGYDHDKYRRLIGSNGVKHRIGRRRVEHGSGLGKHARSSNAPSRYCAGAAPAHSLGDPRRHPRSLPALLPPSSAADDSPADSVRSSFTRPTLAERSPPQAPACGADRPPTAGCRRQSMRSRTVD